MEILTRNAAVSTFFAFVFAIALTLGGCSTGNLAGPDTEPESPEVQTYEFFAPDGDYRNDSGEGGSNTHSDARNEVGQD